MSQFTHIARLVRFGAEDLAFQLGFIPEDKLDWKPDPASKSALQVAGEVIGVMQSQIIILNGGEIEFSNLPHPSTLEEARTQLAATAEEFAGLLESADEAALERRLETPFGPLWASYGVTFGLVDLLHHHGQITYIQSLLGDGENHFDGPIISRWFGPPQ
jgi:hypothetical protein